jgi:hypothetical protein
MREKEGERATRDSKPDIAWQRWVTRVFPLSGAIDRQAHSRSRE